LLYRLEIAELKEEDSYGLVYSLGNASGVVISCGVSAKLY
tara:strand:+ start:80 stop:199 length:120 start_codon:yes stop_codon:yes gene_type:complete